jgi:hypothetical protein
MADDKLWTPASRQVARLDRASAEGKGTEGHFLCALHGAEVAIKLHTVSALALLRDLDEAGSATFAYQLSRADGIGTWESVLRRASASIGRATSRKFDRMFISWLTQKSGRLDADTLAEVALPMAELSAELSLYPPSRQTRPSPIDLMHAMVETRNKTIGHGAFHPEFYAEWSELLDSSVRWLYGNTVLWETELLLVLDRPTKMARILRGSEPHAKTDMSGHANDAGQILLRAHPYESVSELPSLIRVQPSTNGTFLANGSWRDAEGDLEFLDYASSDRTRFKMPSLYAVEPESRTSETEGLTALNAAPGRTMNNLPPEAEAYVSRLALEQDLTVSLMDRRRRHIVTLRGIGGIGKTALALHVCHQIVEQADVFGAIIWMSARDIDLTLSGPVAVRRREASIDDVAHAVCRLLGESPGEGTAMQRCSELLGDESFPVLLVLDNFETFNEPHESYRYFDSSVVPPSKILITSRHEGFRGDYEIPVIGMSRGEASELLRSTARRFNREPLMSDEVIGRIYSYTQGHAYAMKLIASKATSVAGLSGVMDSVVKESELLDALFRRSTEDIGEDAEFVFLLLAQFAGGLSEAALMVAARAQGVDMTAGLAELATRSLIEMDAGSASHMYVLPVMAQRFGRDKLIIGHPLRGSVESEAALVRKTTGLADGDVSIAALDAFQTIRSANVSRAQVERSLLALEVLADMDGSMWVHVAKARREAGRSFNAVEEALKRAAEFDPNDLELLMEWSELPGISEAHAIALKVEAVAVGSEDLEFVSGVANGVNQFLKRHARSYPSLKRAGLTAPVIEAMMRRFDDLDTRDLSRLGWLCMNEGRTDLINDIVNRGLELGPQDGDIKKLALRTKGLVLGGVPKRRPDR